ncbi:hypothetical protein TSUD_33340 [Trifolium subterraneum]|uniref:Uncharacterized protein n=1 Tax=Trifolium subterraneum TaxID=3900 RepID=A0A2Z6LUT5_TRISU|nr:hypothetical protein TSUD_33340 [Trifolium subterraneum]
MTGGEKHKKESSSNEVDQCKSDILKQTIYEYVHKMQQLCLAYNLMQVHYKVKVIIDAEVGSIATKAKEIKATWVILDRFQKKEAGQCVKQLNSNVVLIDHEIPRIIKAVSSMIGENFSKSQNQIKPIEKAIPYILDENFATSTSTSGVRSSTFGTYSFSLPATEKQYHFKTNHCTIDNSHDFLYLNSEYFDEDLKISSSDIDELNHKSIISLLKGETYEI